MPAHEQTAILAESLVEIALQFDSGLHLGWWTTCDYKPGSFDTPGAFPKDWWLGKVDLQVNQQVSWITKKSASNSALNSFVISLACGLNMVHFF